MSGEGLSESDQGILEEIEALKAILFSELDIKYTESGRPTELQIVLYPSTDDADANQHYVCLTLTVKFPQSYPDVMPVVELRNPRGLGDDFLANAFLQCQEKCQDFAGSPVVYELIELLRECLTNSNRPTGHCTICLFAFHPEDMFTYTPCYHHFHSHCLSRFCESLQNQWKEEEAQEAFENPWRDRKPKQFTCPVCREVIAVELDQLKQAPPPREIVTFEEQFQPDAKFKKWKEQMDREYKKQKAQGGIIDPEAEDSRFLVVTENTASNSSSDTTPSVEEPHHPTVIVGASAVNESEPASKTSQSAKPVKSGDPTGKWIRNTESKERTHGAQHSGRLNPPRRPKNPHSNQAKKEEGPQMTKQHNVGSVSAPSRPPPGFAPR